jgi:hypothetical protein
MHRRPRHLPSPALVVACVALVVALCGTGYAALRLPAASVGTAQLKNGAVTNSKVKRRSLTASVFKPGTLLRGPQGAQGLQGSQGVKGDKGDPGPSDAYEGAQSGGFVAIGSSANTTLASVSVPAGAYVVQGSAWILTSAINGNPDQALCTAFSPDNLGVNGRSQFTVSPAGQFTNANHHEFIGTLRVSTAGLVTLHCSAFPVSGGDPADNVQAAFGDVVLIRVGSLTTNP